MAPNTMSKDCIQTEEQSSGQTTTKLDKPYKAEYVWRNIILMALLHSYAIYGIYLAIFKAKLNTILFVHIIAILSSMGVQVGFKYFFGRILQIHHDHPIENHPGFLSHNGLSE